MTAREIIDIYISFFEKRGHKQIMGSALVPENDPTTLFTSSGMQPLVPYLLGETHPAGKRLVDVQNCFRAVDIEEVGDNRHTTFFRMLGNWSLGDYFKEDEINWLWEFLTNKENGLGINPEKLFITVFDGDDRFKVFHDDIQDNLTPDVESISFWNKIFVKENIDVLNAKRINSYDRNSGSKNWWSRSGPPEKMPIGEIGGPDTEVFYDFGKELKLHENSPYKDKECHPNCDCGRFLEIGNAVFMQYKKINDYTFESLPKQNVDFGGGLERLLSAVENQPDIFKTELYWPIIEMIQEYSKASYESDFQKSSMRIIADHLKAATFMIINNITPSNKDQGYLLRRLLRRAAVKMRVLGGGLTPGSFAIICDEILRIEETVDSSVNRHQNRDKVMKIIDEEMEKFGTSLDKGLRELEKVMTELKKQGKWLPMGKNAAEIGFNFYQTYGFPMDILLELLQKEFTIAYEFGMSEMIMEEFEKLRKEHAEKSRSGAEQKFKGGLADHSEKTIMGHTATHLLHKALRDMFGEQLHQTGSNITSERVRFDFNFERKLEDTEIAEIEKVVNGKIAENLPVHFEIMPIAKAKQLGAIGLFDEKYAEDVKVYFVGDYSKELCGGPHVNFTSEIKQFKIIKQENIGHGQRRLYATVG
jgi:alanyl-tRNA synthetase